ncbi:MAG: hypothetical protein EZS28_028657, partial [Streblomastix strix]
MVYVKRLLGLSLINIQIAAQMNDANAKKIMQEISAGKINHYPPYPSLDTHVQNHHMNVTLASAISPFITLLFGLDGQGNSDFKLMRRFIKIMEINRGWQNDVRNTYNKSLLQKGRQSSLQEVRNIPLIPSGRFFEAVQGMNYCSAELQSTETTESRLRICLNNFEKRIRQAQNTPSPSNANQGMVSCAPSYGSLFGYGIEKLLNIEEDQRDNAIKQINSEYFKSFEQRQSQQAQLSYIFNNSQDKKIQPDIQSNISKLFAFPSLSKIVTDSSFNFQDPISSVALHQMIDTLFMIILLRIPNIFPTLLMHPSPVIQEGTLTAVQALLQVALRLRSVTADKRGREFFPVQHAARLTRCLMQILSQREQINSFDQQLSMMKMHQNRAYSLPPTIRATMEAAQELVACDVINPEKNTHSSTDQLNNNDSFVSSSSIQSFSLTSILAILLVTIRILVFFTLRSPLSTLPQSKILTQAEKRGKEGQSEYRLRQKLHEDITKEDREMQSNNLFPISTVGIDIHIRKVFEENSQSDTPHLSHVQSSFISFLSSILRISASYDKLKRHRSSVISQLCNTLTRTPSLSYTLGQTIGNLLLSNLQSVVLTIQDAEKKNMAVMRVIGGIAADDIDTERSSQNYVVERQTRLNMIETLMIYTSYRSRQYEGGQPYYQRTPSTSIQGINQHYPTPRLSLDPNRALISGFIQSGYFTFLLSPDIRCSTGICQTNLSLPPPSVQAIQNKAILRNEMIDVIILICKHSCQLLPIQLSLGKNTELLKRGILSERRKQDILQQQTSKEEENLDV